MIVSLDHSRRANCAGVGEQCPCVGVWLETLAVGTNISALKKVGRVGGSSSDRRYGHAGGQNAEDLRGAIDDVADC